MKQIGSYSSEIHEIDRIHCKRYNDRVKPKRKESVRSRNEISPVPENRILRYQLNK